MSADGRDREPDSVIRLKLERRGDDWTGRALWVDPEGFGFPAETAAPVGSPGEALEELALPLDAVEAERVTAAKTAEREAGR